MKIACAMAKALSSRLPKMTSQASVVRDLLKRERELSPSTPPASDGGLVCAAPSREPLVKNCGKDIEPGRKVLSGWASRPPCTPERVAWNSTRSPAEMDAAWRTCGGEYPGENVEEPFTRGYQRGREHYQKLCDEAPKARRRSGDLVSGPVVQIFDGLLHSLRERLQILHGQPGGRDRLSYSHLQRTAFDVIGIHRQQLIGADQRDRNNVYLSLDR